MLNLKIHHIGYLVRKKDAARAAFEDLGYRVRADWVRDESRGIDISFIEKDGTCIELVSPYRKDSDVSGLLQRMKNTPYHICYLSAHFTEDLSALREMGYLPITSNGLKIWLKMRFLKLLRTNILMSLRRAETT